jgi:hypothetical protein
MTPLRITLHTFGPYRSHGVGADHRTEWVPKPEERLISGNGPVRILVENGKKLKVPKVIKP